MSFDILTNVAALQAQNYLRTNSNFQMKTIDEVTSGLRIVQSGDDAAGLAIANADRSNEAVLTQGISNANDGLSSLQTMDAGMSNISQLLDRARTLATQSASGTFTGDRGGLNTEFQGVLTEIDRQAQAIGLNTGGSLAKNLSVFVGGGQGSTSAAAIQNGSVGVDLSNSAVDSKSLGLNAFQAANTGYDLSDTSATSVAKIIANAGNTTSGAAITTADFIFSGAGFSNTVAGLPDSQMRITVGTQGIKDAAGLATAINNAIYNAANPNPSQTTAAQQAFKAAGITASVVTDAAGHQQLAFNAASTAFQVHGDQLANAFLGFVADSTSGHVKGAGSTFVQASGVLSPITTDLSAVKLKFTDKSGAIIAGLGNVSLGQGVHGSSASPITAQAAVIAINASLNAAATTNASGSSNIQAELKDGKLAFYAKDGSEFNVQIAGDPAVANSTLGVLGFANSNNTAVFPTPTSTVQTTAIAARNVDNLSTVHLQFTATGGAALTGNDAYLSNVAGIALGAGTTDTDPHLLATINGALNAAAVAAGQGPTSDIQATFNGNTLIFTSASGQSFQANVWDTNAGTGATDLGYAASTTVAAANTNAVASTLTATGSSKTANLTETFNTDFHTVTLAFTDANGNAFATNATGLDGLGSVTLTGVTGTATSDQALASAINAKLDAAASGGVSSIRAGVTGAGTIAFTSTDGTAFKVRAWGTNDTLLGFNTAGTQATDPGANSPLAKASSYTVATTNAVASQYQGLISGGVYQSAQEVSTGASTDYENSAYFFKGLSSGNAQTFTVNATQSDGSVVGVNVQLNNTNAGDVNTALNTINAALQASAAPSLMGITAVRDQSGIRLISQTGFSATLGAPATTAGEGLSEMFNGSTKQAGVQINATVQGTSGLADISTQIGAENAVATIAKSVLTLGNAQAAVGRGENLMSYATNLAQSQLTNTQTAESRIRDADLAAQAANLTKAQVLIQAGVAALAQANSSTQQVLTLLR